MSTSTRAFMLAGVAIMLTPGTSTSEDSKLSGYVVESYPGSVVTSGFGQCWHTSYWTRDARIEQCDPDAPATAKAPAAEPSPAPAVPAPAPQAEQQPAPPVTQPLQSEDTTSTPLPPPERPADTAAAARNPRLDTALLPQTVHYSTDAFFDFDESILRPEGRAALDEFVSELSEVKYGSIRVVGHTDRIGSDAYNQALSERRANAVRKYLSRKNVPSDRIKAVGKGKSEPTVKTSMCNGPKSPKVIKCLQPDRRVDIEVAGTKDATTGSR